MNNTPAVSRAPAGGIAQTTPRESPPQAARSALDVEHGRQADQRVKGPHAIDLTQHPSVPSPVGKTDCRAQGSRVTDGHVVASYYTDNNYIKTPTPQCLLKNAVGLAISRFLGDNPTFHRQFISPKWCRKNRRCGPAARRMMRWNGSAISSVMQRRRWAATAVFGVNGPLIGPIRAQGTDLQGCPHAARSAVAMRSFGRHRVSEGRLCGASLRFLRGPVPIP